ncbi:MAG: homoserine dehydrogenase, partial [Ekhidna sp.]|nr:homoserine dehydrogenase [Ekhidna sp.]
TNNPDELLNDPEIDIIIEVIDDAKTAKNYVKTALSNGKSVISANKKMIAESLSEIDEWHKYFKSVFLYEAAVGGGIPIVHSMDSFFRDQEVVKIRGILNGSSNYILTQMQQNQWEFEHALKDAQLQGFAERNPTLDITGVDASYKLSILAYHAFGEVPSLSQFSTESIENISKESIKRAKTKGRKIKPVATIERSITGITCEVKAEAIGPNDELYSVDFENNAVSVETLTSGKHTFSGKGAGSLPTGLAVIEDLKRLLNGYSYQVSKEMKNVA